MHLLYPHFAGVHKLVTSSSTQEAVALKENLCYGPITSPPPPVSSDSAQGAVALQENPCYNPVSSHPTPAASTPAAAATVAQAVAEYEEIGASSAKSTQTGQQQQS